MAKQRKTVIRGILEVGFVRASVDVPFGKTTPAGAAVAFSGTDLDVESGQSTLIEESFRTADRVEITPQLLFADLSNLADALGVGDAAVTGDLNGGTPTPEVLELLFNGQLGQKEETLYLITPGPKGTRRWEFNRVKVQPGLSLDNTRDNHVTVAPTFKLMNPKDPAAKPVKITDAI